jgi:hypothetical protein
MFRAVIAASVGALVLMTLLTATPAQLFATSAVMPSTHQVPPMPLYQQRPVVLARTGAPRMFGDVSGAVGSLPMVDATTVLVAKSEADMLLDDTFAAFPLAVVGAIFGYAALGAAQSTLEVEIPEGKEGPVILVACIGGAAFLVIASNVGILNFFSGVLAKGLLDGWNVIANAVLKGAILKY